MEQEKSGLNTGLLIVILVIIVGVGVWWFTSRQSVPQEKEKPGINVDVNLPGGNDDANNAPQGGTPSY